ncbi:hypothetical protein BDD12DRAFT_878148 [Trichophaea hybrida]|nr:hypothetical protein BDD12DRAFT_878148 [Trichophaea hybrida]
MDVILPDGLTTGERDGLIGGIIGIVIAAVTMLKGWECRNSRRRAQDRTDSVVDPEISDPSPTTAVINNFYYYLPAPPPTHSGIPVSPSHNLPASNSRNIPMQPITPQSHSTHTQPLPSPLPLPPPPALCLEPRAAGTKPGRVSTWPDAIASVPAGN